MEINESQKVSNYRNFCLLSIGSVLGPCLIAIPAAHYIQSPREWLVMGLGLFVCSVVGATGIKLLNLLAVLGAVK